MRHRLLSACVALLLGFPLWASGFTPDLSHLGNLPLHQLPPQIVSKAVYTAQSKFSPYQFAVGVSMPLAIQDGLWQMLDDGSWSWRTRIYSANAQTLNVHFKFLQLPPGASLWIYDAAGQRVEGPYTQTNLSKDGQLWTPVVPGTTAIIEIRAPAAVKDQVQVQVGEVNHGFRGFGKAGSNLYGFGTSGACEVNVVCPTVSAWYPTPADSVARIEIGGEYLCSGSLINNVLGDNTPYFLTAHHCQIPTYTADSVVFYWNYQFTSCSDSSTQPSYQTQTGSTLIADDQDTDFTLVELKQPPAAPNAYLNGWDASPTDVPSSGAVIHHPSGDVKKTSLYSTAPMRQSNVQLIESSGNVNLTGVWNVSYSLGVTEEGSSGSPLLNQNQQVVGQLSGGSSACTGTSGNGQSDVYSRTDVAWTANATASGQLKAWLDPGNTGTLRISGQAYSATSSSSGGGSSSSSGGSSGSSSGSGGSHGGEFTPLTLAGLLLLVLLRRTPDILRRRRQRQNSGA